MSFREWLYAQLVADEVIDNEETTIEDLSKDMLITETSLYEDDIKSYENDFREYCDNTDQEPDWDLPED